MAFSSFNIVLFFAVITAYCGLSSAAVPLGKNSTKGICHLEVPTVDLLSEDEKNLAHTIKGNGSRPGLSKIQVCCSGYKLEPHTFFYCVPQCDNDCEHGNCTAPNVCVCHKGYIKGPQDRCVPTCPTGCLNGVCTYSGSCSCNAGYALDPRGQFCVPQCQNGCGIAGECVAPNDCKCKPGFTKNPQGACSFHCEGGCLGGECIGPNQCSCKAGYDKVGSSCIPRCSRGCKNGECTAPEKCTCKPKWTLDATGSICEAHCSQPCLNADCTGADECTCKFGYTKDPTSFTGNRCIPQCVEGCENGICSGPNFCICNQGFVKQARGSNKCIRRVRRSTLFHPELIPHQIFQ